MVILGNAPNGPIDLGSSSLFTNRRFKKKTRKVVALKEHPAKERRRELGENFRVFHQCDRSFEIKKPQFLQILLQFPPVSLARL